jgi:hypothetical protein
MGLRIDLTMMECPSLMLRVAGRGRVRPTMKPLYRPRDEGEESDEEGGSDKDDDVEDIYNNMSIAERERC